jgi:hypothetical protein
MNNPEKFCPYMDNNRRCVFGTWTKKPLCHKQRDVAKCPKYRAFKERLDRYESIEKKAPVKVVGRFSAILGKWI